MKKMTVICILLIIINCFSISVNAEKIYTIGDIKKLAGENSVQTLVDNMNIEAKESALNEALYNVNVPGFYSSGEEKVNDEINKQMAPVYAKIDLEVAKLNKINNVKSNALESYKKANDIIKTKKVIEFEKQKLSIMQDQYRIGLTKIKKGTILQSDIDDIEYNIDLKKLDIEKLEKQLDLLYIDLKNIINLSSGEVITINGDSSYNKSFDISIEKVLPDIIEKNTSVFEKTEYLKAKEKYLEIVKKYYTNKDNKFDNAELELESAKYDLEDAKRLIEINIKDLYDELKNCEGNLSVVSTYNKLVKKSLDGSKIKYDKGVISQEAYLSEKLRYLDTLIQQTIEVYNCSAAKADLLYSLNMDI